MKHNHKTGGFVGAGPQTRPSRDAARHLKNVYACGDFQPQRTQRTQSTDFLIVNCQLRYLQKYIWRWRKHVTGEHKVRPYETKIGVNNASFSRGKPRVCPASFLTPNFFLIGDIP
jgi:hypothetical protein